MAEQQKVEQNKQLEEAAQKARNAKRAGSSISGGPTGDVKQVVPSSASLRDTIRSAMVEHS